MNAAAIPTTLGVGRNGNIGILMDTAAYANVATTAYERPDEPGPYAKYGPGDSVAARSDENVIHK